MIEKQRFSFKVADHSPDFWDRFERGKWEPETIAFLESQVRLGMTFIDLGGWQGPTTLTAAALGAKVFAFEPNPDSRKALEESVALNDFRDNVTVFPYAVSAVSGSASLAVPKKGSPSSSLVRRAKAATAVEVECVTPDFIARLCEPGATLIKIDIEGSEYGIIEAIADIALDHRAAVLLSTHPHKAVDFPSKAALARNPMLVATLASRLIHARGQMNRFPKRQVVSPTKDGALKPMSLFDGYGQSQVYLSH
ncbi:FkbM family methyltransferase [Mesorhizobium sp. BHbsci]